MSLVPLTLRDPFWDDPHFANARGEFVEMRRKMMKEAKDFWSKAEEDSFPSIQSMVKTALFIPCKEILIAGF